VSDTFVKFEPSCVVEDDPGEVVRHAAPRVRRPNGYTRAKLAEWGIPWPPPKGWRKKLIAAGRLPAVTEDVVGFNEDDRFAPVWSRP
jgi:hypothetical protein